MAKKDATFTKSDNKVSFLDAEGELQRLLDAAEDETLSEEEQNDLSSELYGALDVSAQKRDSVAYYIKRELSDAEHFKAVANELYERAKVHENKAARIKDMVLRAMKHYNIDTLSGETFKFKMARNPDKVEVTIPVEQLPVEYVVSKTTYAPDKRGLKDALEAGEEIHGVFLTHGEQRVDIKLK